MELAHKHEIKSGKIKMHQSSNLKYKTTLKLKSSNTKIKKREGTLSS